MTQKMTPKTASKTQSKMINKAQKRLWMQGYEGTSLNQVVNDAGVSKGAFFHYYPNKYAISEQVITKYVNEHLLQTLDENMKDVFSVKNGLLDWMMGFYQSFEAQNWQGGCLLGNMALELSDQNTAARESISQHFLNLENALAGYLKPLEREGKLLIERRQLSRLLIACIQGITMMVKVHKDDTRAARNFQAIAQFIEFAIKD